MVDRLQNILSLAMAVALLLALVLITSKEVITRRTAAIQAGNAWLSTLAVQAESAMAFDDAKTAKEMLLATSTFPGLQAATIFRADGSVLADYAAKHETPISSVNGLSAQVATYFEPYLMVSQPIVVSGTTLGSAQARLDLMAMWRSIAEFVLSIIVGLGVAGFASLIVARRFLRRALAPISSLKSVMDIVSQQEKFTVRAPLVANDEVGALTKVFNHMLDQIVSRDRQLEESNIKLVALKDAAEQASNTKSEFLALMSHELRTPMAGVLGMLSLALRGQMEQTVRERVELASGNARALLQIVNDLLDVSKIEAGKLDLEAVDFALAPMLNDAMRLLQERAKQKSVYFKLEIAPDVPPFLIGDPTRLRQVLLNLVSNAIKFTEHGGITVTVRVDSPADTNTTPSLLFAVKDSGIGISEEAQGRMFQKFEQADVSTTRKFGGTGLGLSICKQLVELMGGHIGLSSKIGEGSTFFFAVPLPIGKQPTEDDNASLAPHAYQLKVLVAEDAETNQLIIQALLDEMGHNTVMAGDGEQALRALLREHFDVILMDGRMPVMDGLEATGHIRAGHWGDHVFPDKQIPIIALTANAAAQDRAKFLAGGMDDFLSKPVDEGELHKALSRVIEQRLAAGLALQPRATADLGALDALIGAPIREPRQPASNAASDFTGSTPPTESRIQRARALRERMLDAFRKQAITRIEDIENATANGDWHNAAVMVHGLKGSIAYLWPDSDVYLLSAQLEKLADQGDVTVFQAGFAQLKSGIAAKLAPRSGGSRAPTPTNRDRLSVLREVDIQVGIHHMGGRHELYLSILERFRTGQADALKTIQASIEAGNLEEAVRTVHTLKGLAASIGAKRVESLAEQLESHLMSTQQPLGMDDALTNDMDALQPALQALFDELASIAPATTPSADMTPDTAQDLVSEQARVPELIALLAESSGEAPLFFELHYEALLRVLGQARLDVLARHIDAFDFDAAKAALATD